MQSPLRKSSSALRLVLMGAAVGGSGLLGGCDTDVQRNRYASRADCVADYSEAQCQSDFPVGAAVAAGAATYYFGPWYRTGVATAARGSGDPGPGRFFSSGSARGSTSPPAGVEAGTRGGFGSHGHVSERGS